MDLLLATAGLAEVGEEAIRELEYFLCLISLTPAVIWFLGLGVWWMLAKKSRNFGRLLMLMVPGLAWIYFFALWPSWLDFKLYQYHGYH